VRACTQGPKQYVQLAGQALVGHTLTALKQVPRLHGVMVMLAPDDRSFEREVPGFAGPHRWVVRNGGPTRATTVANGLKALREHGAADADWVLVHDAARALLRPEWVDRLIDACLADAVGGLLALPVGDTLKGEEGGRAAATVDRRGKWAAQTPQMFRLGMLRAALAAAGDAVTDEASAVEHLGLSPLLVKSDATNLKVTYPEDLHLAEAILKSR
jgi:2-C-methyl-D-erythritol 4-phosphate cytidylyltransferase